MFLRFFSSFSKLTRKIFLPKRRPQFMYFPSPIFIFYPKMGAVGFCCDFPLILLFSFISTLFLLFCNFAFNSFSPHFLLQKTDKNKRIWGFWNSSEFDVNTKEEEMIIFPEDANFILPSFPKGQCGGLGNQMFRFASLYGIGRPLNRVPAFAKYQHCGGMEDHGNGKEWFNETNLPFPLYKKYLRFMDTPSNETAFLPNFGLDCCKFDDPNLLSAKFPPNSVNIRFLQTLANYLQSYKYFHKFRHQIRQIFQCSPELIRNARQIHSKLFGVDKRHKLCVHTRRGDFEALWFESKKEFTEKAVTFLYKKLEQIHQNSPQVVFFGEDKKFLRSLKLDQIRPHFVEGYSRNEEFCLAIHSCHSLLLTASASTFGWWIGYLMGNKGGHVFYNSNLNFTHYTRENFPDDWIPIWLEGGQIMTMEFSGPIRVYPTKNGTNLHS